MKQNDLPHWDRIITKAGVKPEKLANALEQHGSLEKFYQHRQEEEQKLGITINELKNQVKTLTEERQKICADISIVRKEALAGIVNISKKTMETMDSLAAKSEESINSQQQSTAEVIKNVGQKTQAEVEAISKKALEDMQLFVNQANRYASLEHSAGVLSQELVIARALKNQDPAYWQKVPFHSIREMLNGIVLWSRTGGDHNPLLLAPPYPLSGKIHLYQNNVTLGEVLEWTVVNIVSDAEEKAVTSGYILNMKKLD